MAKVRDLIEGAAAGRGAFTLQGQALKDLRTVLAANDKQSHRFKRVSLPAFVEYLKTEHKIEVSPATLARYLHTTHGRAWSL